RIGKDEVGLEVGVEVTKEAIRGLGPEIGVDSPDGEIHAGQAPGGGVGLLAVDGEILSAAAVLLDEAIGGDEHAARAAAGVENPAAEGLQHGNQELDDALRRVELAAALTLGRRESAEEVFVDPAEDVL